MTAISKAELFEDLKSAWEELMRGTGLPNKLRFINGDTISKNRLLGQFPNGVYLKWIDFYEVEFNGCIGKKVIIGDG